MTANGGTASWGSLTTLSSPAIYEHWKSKYLLSDGNRKYVAYNLDNSSWVPNAVTTSESTGYGLLITVLASQKDDFDSLLAFRAEHTIQTSGPEQALMLWCQVKDPHTGVIGDIVPRYENDAKYKSATDGDLDTAYALLLAGKKWGSSYTDIGKQVCQALHDTCLHKETGIFLTNSNANSGYDWVTRSSDWMLGHLRLFAEVDTDRQSQWRDVLQKHIDAYKFNLKYNEDKLGGAYSGLISDFLVYDGNGSRQYLPATGYVREKDTDKNYHYNACRIPWRLAAYIKNAAPGDTGVVDMQWVIKAFEGFFVGVLASSDPKVHNGYTLQGASYGDGGVDLAFTAPAWLLLKVLNSKGGQAGNSLEQQVLYMANDPSKDQYYGVSILLLTVLQLENVE